MQEPPLPKVGIGAFVQPGRQSQALLLHIRLVIFWFLESSTWKPRWAVWGMRRSCIQRFVVGSNSKVLLGTVLSWLRSIG